MSQNPADPTPVEQLSAGGLTWQEWYEYYLTHTSEDTARELASFAVGVGGDTIDITGQLGNQERREQ